MLHRIYMFSACVRVHVRVFFLTCFVFLAQRRHARAAAGAPLVASPSRGGNRLAPVHAVKLVAVGDQIGSEKTTLLLSFAHDKFPEDYVPTVFEK